MFFNFRFQSLNKRYALRNGVFCSLHFTYSKLIGRIYCQNLIMWSEICWTCFEDRIDFLMFYKLKTRWVRFKQISADAIFATFNLAYPMRWLAIKRSKAWTGFASTATNRFFTGFSKREKSQIDWDFLLWRHFRPKLNLNRVNKLGHGGRKMANGNVWNFLDFSII